MAVVLIMRVPELSPERYDRVTALLELDAQPAAGLIEHMATESAGAMNFIEVWQTPEAAEAFITGRLRPLLERNGVGGPLSYRFEPMRNLFAAQMEMIERIGSTSIPAGVPRIA